MCKKLQIVSLMTMLTRSSRLCLWRFIIREFLMSVVFIFYLSLGIKNTGRNKKAVARQEGRYFIDVCVSEYDFLLFLLVFFNVVLLLILTLTNWTTTPFPQICCCVGGHQKQKLIDSMLEANKSLAKEIARLEGVEKTLKTTLMKRERTIKEKDQEIESLQDENATLVTKVEKQRRQLDNW